jgi:hypothetical protein
MRNIAGFLAIGVAVLSTGCCNTGRQPILPRNGFAVRANYLATTDVLAQEFTILFI